MERYRLEFGSFCHKPDGKEYAVTVFNKMDGMAEFGITLGILSDDQKEAIDEEFYETLNFGGALKPFCEILGPDYEGYEGGLIAYDDSRYL